MNQSVNQSVNQSINQSINQSFNQSINQSIYQSIKLSTYYYQACFREITSFRHTAGYIAQLTKRPAIAMNQ